MHCGKNNVQWLILFQSTVEDCLKCLLKVPHKRCESVSNKRNTPYLNIPLVNVHVSFNIFFFCIFAAQVHPRGRGLSPWLLVCQMFAGRIGIAEAKRTYTETETGIYS